MKHLKLFKTQAEFDLATLELPNVSYIEENSGIYYHPQNKIDYSKEYFTIEALEDGLIARLTRNESYYRIDNGDWTLLPSYEYTPTINTGQKIQFKITDPSISSN
jgi:hypothetical protein